MQKNPELLFIHTEVTYLEPQGLTRITVLLTV
jgi:hypothetical protein